MEKILELYRSIAGMDSASIENRKAFAAALAPIVNAEVARESVVRQIFAVDKIEFGTEARYPLDTEKSVAVTMPIHGGVPQRLVESGEAYVRTYEIADSVEWKLQYAREARFNVLQRQMDKMKNAFIRKEDSDGLAVVRAAAALRSAVGGADVTKLDISFLNSLWKEIESQEGYKPDLFVLSPRRAADFREWAGTSLTPETFKEIHSGAAVGNFWGVDIMRSWDLADDEVYLFDTTRFGVMPVKLELQIYEDISAISSLRVRFIGHEEVGFGMLDAKAVVKGKIGK